MSGKNHLSLLFPALCICAIAGAAHLLFSSLGFNPTDDGFTLAYSRRLLEGQAPHRDFIIIRPALSPAMHIPALLCGKYAFWVSRLLVWVELACISWIWSALVRKMLGAAFSKVERVCLAAIAFAFCAHTFPIIAWHTIDGLFLLSAGLGLRKFGGERLKALGYFVIGAACLCKQSFVFAGPVAAIVLGDWRKPKRCMPMLLPGALYLGFALAIGAFGDAIAQLGAQSGLRYVGLLTYNRPKTLLGIIAGYLAMRAICGAPSIQLFASMRKTARLAGAAMILGVIALGAKSLAVNGLFDSSFGIFGLALGATAYYALEKWRAEKETVRAGILSLLAAWSVAISLGYNSPALASGCLVALLLTFAFKELDGFRGAPRGAVLAGLAFVVLAGFFYARRNHIYREQPAAQLTVPLDGLLAGGKSIRTNPNTAAFMADLQKAIDFVTERDMIYAILPAVAAHWAMSEEPNPLPIDWAQGTELNRDELAARVVASLESNRGGLAAIVQKVKASEIWLRAEPLPDTEHFKVAQYARSHFTKGHETEYFEIYW